MFDKTKTILWIEEYLFYPKTFLHYFLSFLLLPFTLIYCVIVISKRILAKKIDTKIPIISIGNLTLGGSGKTPLTIELAKDYENCTIILRGFKRETKGLLMVSHNHKILCDVKQSGDEAMLYAISVPNSTVIVSEDRLKAIELAKSLACNIIFLDDGFSKSNIKKFDILIKPKIEPKIPFCVPSGAYREPRFLYKYADLVVEEDKDFKRIVKIKNKTDRMVLVTGISKPARLKEYLPKDLVGVVFYEDHHSYNKEELLHVMKKYNATTILTTQKDEVKMKAFGLNLSILELGLEVKPEVKNKINTFLANFR